MMQILQEIGTLRKPKIGTYEDQDMGTISKYAGMSVMWKSQLQNEI